KACHFHEEVHPLTHLNPMPSPLWFSRWLVSRWIIYYVIAIGGYLANLVSTGRLTLAPFLMLTLTYDAWLAVVHLRKRFDPHPPWWILGLVCLACVSQFIPVSNTNLSWLPILPTASACLIVARTPRAFGLIMAGVLWLSSSFAFSLDMHGWDINAQLTLLVS